MNKVLVWAIIISLGGFLFGFDTVVISGAEKSIQQQWELSSLTQGFLVAIALWGTFIGAMLGGIPSNVFGRKTTLWWIGIFYLVSAVGTAFAPEIYSFLFFRFLGGLGVGASSVTAPVYISEISQAKNRGWLVATFQLNLVLGILVAQLSNFWISQLDLSEAWRWMLGMEAIPAVAFVLLTKQLPRSPRWLVTKMGLIDEARRILQVINPQTADTELEKIKESVSTENRLASSGVGQIFSSRYTLVILLAFLFALFNQFSGINSVLYYSNRIFSDAGLAEEASYLSTVGLGAVNLVFTILGMILIDRMGRKTLMYVGSLGYIVSLFFIGHSFSQQTQGMSVPVWCSVFIASHAIGQGAVIWVFISEIFPNKVRAIGMSIGSGTHWFFNALIQTFFPYFSENPEVGTSTLFFFFSGMMVLQLFFVWFLMPETKDVSLEELEKKLIK